MIYVKRFIDIKGTKLHKIIMFCGKYAFSVGGKTIFCKITRHSHVSRDVRLKSEENNTYTTQVIKISLPRDAAIGDRIFINFVL